MCSGLLERFRRNIAVRLSLWYALIFTLSSLALFSLAYYLLAGAVGSKDREVLEARLKEVAAVYNGGGVPVLLNWVRKQPPAGQQRLFIPLLYEVDKILCVMEPTGWGHVLDLTPNCEDI